MNHKPEPYPAKTKAEAAFEESLCKVVDADVSALIKARKNYGESWCKRGGTGAFMMLARKWDRLENYLANPPSEHVGPHATSPAFDKYDILRALGFDRRPEGLIDDVRDLRRYLILVEAKLSELGIQVGKLAKDEDDEGQPTAGQLNGE